MQNLANKVQLIGNLGGNPVVKRLADGKPMARFSLATSEYYTAASGEKKRDTQWHNVVAFGHPALKAEKFLKKGSRIVCIGKLNHRQFEDSDGHKRSVTEVVVNELLMLRSNAGSIAS